MTQLSTTATDAIRDALVAYMGLGPVVRRVDARKGNYFDCDEALFVDVVFDRDADVPFDSVIGAEDVVKRALNGEAKEAVPVMSFYKETA